MKHCMAMLFWPLLAIIGMLLLGTGTGCVSSAAGFFDLDGKRDIGVKLNILGNTIEYTSSINGEYGKHETLAATASQAAVAANTAAAAANTAATAANTAAAAAATSEQLPAVPASPAARPEAVPVEKGPAKIDTAQQSEPATAQSTIYPPALGLEFVLADGRDWG